MSRNSNQTAASLLVIGLVAAAFHIAGSHPRWADAVQGQDRLEVREPS